MTEDDKLQDGPLLSFTVRSFEFNLDLGRVCLFVCFVFSSMYIYISAARIDSCKYLRVLLVLSADPAHCFVLHEWERLQKLIFITDLHAISSVCILYPINLSFLESKLEAFRLSNNS